MINDKKRDELKTLAALFDGLGHYRRLLVVKALQQAGDKGLGFGALADLTGMGEANLAHHMRMLKKGGLVNTHRVGRNTVVTLNQARLIQNLTLLSGNANL